jgi:hypothetical protein
MNDTILLNTGMRALVDTLGVVEAERFIFLMNDEPFDYTKWHGILSEGKTIEEIHESAKRRRERDHNR